MNYTDKLNQANEEMGKLGKESPEVMGAFMKLHHEGGVDGALAAKYKELIALGIAIHTQCEGCIVCHTHDAMEAGASHAEIVEAINTAVVMGGGPCVIYGAKAIAALQEFESKK